ncbi:vitamin K epoxide reductase complex subunit 1-like protein 1 [Cimex lectularius]|uniref:vitamin-K-epoxide reductase (warfarin-sensitive) n=1 Tax=Cimex lectularius TaxID=79782 RepID=A0A8I6RIZ8_CIMLE|nr:vitamin K epoxide reductase complex subunit 1-like protein 1 [Cimex lectularius]
MPINKLKLQNFTIKLFSVLGFLVSLYSYYVEMKVEHDKNYIALCDISEHISCSKAFNSHYGRGFGILNDIFGEGSILDQPNSLYGMFAYFGMFLLALTDRIKMSRVFLNVTVMCNVMSVYLGYILIFILKDFCVICVSTYVINFVLVVAAYKKYHHLISLSHEHDRKNQ